MGSYSQSEQLWRLKVESKSRANLGIVTIAESREAVNRYGGTQPVRSQPSLTVPR